MLHVNQPWVSDVGPVKILHEVRYFVATVTQTFESNESLCVVRIVLYTCSHYRDVLEATPVWYKTRKKSGKTFCPDGDIVFKCNTHVNLLR